MPLAPYKDTAVTLDRSLDKVTSTVPVLTTYTPRIPPMPLPTALPNNTSQSSSPVMEPTATSAWQTSQAMNAPANIYSAVQAPKQDIEDNKRWSSVLRQPTVAAWLDNE